MATNKDLEVGEIVSKSEQFIEKNSRKIIYGIIAITVVVGAYLGFRYGYTIPRENEATEAMFKGEYFFSVDSFVLALNGNGMDFAGFEAIANDYSGTAAGNLAKAYTGICYFKLGDNESAIKHLKSFNGKDKVVSPAIIGLIGDCYVNSGNIKEGINYFEKAAERAAGKISENNIISPIYLKKAGIAYESLQQYQEAVKVYTTIKEKYFSSTEASDIDKYIARATELGKL